MSVSLGPRGLSALLATTMNGSFAFSMIELWREASEDGVGEMEGLDNPLDNDSDLQDETSKDSSPVDEAARSFEAEDSEAGK